ncbi:MAG: PRC-barrel domain-containing protein [Rhizobium sp.]|nr:PRC-barrel domain-containing protein [Rhizobium sp.]
MNRITLSLAATVLILSSGLAGSALSQGAKQTVTLMEVKPETLATGYRSSKVVGSDVYNDTNDKIGQIDDLIVTPADNVPYAVLSVGGFLGMGKHYVVVAASSLEVVNKRMVLKAGTKETLKALPEYSYATE